ncbi:MAG: TonB-dependent receptor, partial [Phenylobacterium sp.]|uniref:TonB-dependent receptor n=1 Tax=Phenylobacterium sp. TaxID=1871053 RepID=UPI00273626E5
VSQELRLAGELPGDGHFVVGASAAYDKVFQDDFMDLSQSTIGYVLTGFGLPVFEGYDAINDQRIQNQAVFASVDFNVTETLSLTAGARYTKTDDKFNGCTADKGAGNMQATFGNLWNFLRSTQGLPPNPPIPLGGCGTSGANFVPGMIHNNLKEDNVSWRAGAEWKPRERTLVYANVSKGYKAGSFPILGATRNPQFDPATQESVLAYEVGFKSTLLSQTLQLNGAAFYYDYRDKQILGRVLDPTLGSLLALVNVPRADVRGAELQAIWSPIRGLTVNTGLSYIKSRILGGFANYDPNGAFKSFDDEAFPNTPKWQFVSDVNYTWSLTDSLNGFVGGNVTYQSRTNSQLGELPTLKTKAYALVDLRAGVETADGKWRVSAWGRNVGNTYYWTAANRATDFTVRFAGMPATYGIAVSRRFD